MAGPLREFVRVQSGLEVACCLFLRARACFLCGFVEDLSNRIVSEVAGLWRTGRLRQKSQKRSRTPPHKGHCVSWFMLQGGADKVGVAVEMR